MAATNKKSQTPLPVRPLKLWLDDSTQEEVRIEIIPLIDVIFCILTFFILAAVGFSRQQAISLDLPKASTGAPQMREMLIVSLDDLGQVYVEQQAVTKNQLYQAIRNYHQLNPGGLMVLNAARNTSYNEVVEVLDMLREVGGDRVALATLPGESDSNPPPANPDSNYVPPYVTPVPGGTYNPALPNYPNSDPGLGQYNPSTPNLPVPSDTAPSDPSASPDDPD